MKKSFIIALLAIASISNLYAQDKKEEQLKTKMDMFASKTGVITKFTDFKLPSINSLYSLLEVRVRKISSGQNQPSYFFQITKEGKYSNSTASIEYTDLLEVIKALTTLKKDVDADLANPNYTENKFITSDGFQIGYYTQNNKSVWYMKLEKYGSDNTVYVNSVEQFESAFNGAKSKIDEIKVK